MSELEYFVSFENIEISLYAQARQSLLLLTQGNIYNRLRFLNKYLMFLEELNELFRENWSKFLTAGYLVFLQTLPGCRVSRHALFYINSSLFIHKLRDNYHPCPILSTRFYRKKKTKQNKTEVLFDRFVLFGE